MKREEKSVNVESNRTDERGYIRGKLKLCYFIVILGMIIIPSSVKSANLDDILSNVAKNTKSNDTLSETIVVTMNIPGAKKTEKMKLYKKGESKVRIENLGRRGGVTIINGEKMLMKVDGKEVIKKTDKSNKLQLLQTGGSMFDVKNMKENYKITIKENRGNIAVLHLVPNKKEKMYNSLDMVIDKNNWRVIEQKMYSNTGIAKMEIGYDKAGNISRIEMNTPLPHGGERGTIKIEYSGISRGNIVDKLFDIK